MRTKIAFSFTCIICHSTATVTTDGHAQPAQEDAAHDAQYVWREWGQSCGFLCPCCQDFTNHMETSA